MAETFTDKLKLSKRDTGDLNWGQGANANLEALDQHIQQALLRPPRTLTATLGSGGVGPNLSGNTAYFYKITAVNAAGETTEGKVPSTVEAQVTQPAVPLPVILQWETVKGATGYKIYKATSSGQEKFLASVSGEATSNYTDDGSAATNPAISVPASNSARTSVSRIIAGANVTVSPVDGTGEVTVNAAGGASPPDASDTVKGVTKLSAAPAVPTNPIAVGDNDSRMTNIPASGEKAALAGTSGTPSGTNKYVTDQDPRNTDARTPTAHALAGAAHSADTVANLNSKLTDGPLAKLSEVVAKTLADAKGDLVVGSGADAFSRLAAGADGKVLKANSGAAVGLEWGDVSGGGYATVVVPPPTLNPATDTANIQAALDALSSAVGSAGGGTVILREGDYVVNQIIIRRDGTHLIGSGPGWSGNSQIKSGTRIRGNSQANNLIKIEAEHVMVENITFVGFHVADGFSIVAAGSDLYAPGTGPGSGQDLCFSKCAFVDIRSPLVAGIRASGLHRLRILDCLFFLNESVQQTVARTPIGIKIGQAAGQTNLNVEIARCFFRHEYLIPGVGGSILAKDIEIMKTLGASVVDCHSLVGNAAAGLTHIFAELKQDAGTGKGININGNNLRRHNNFIKQTGGFTKVAVSGNAYTDHQGTDPAIDLVSGNTEWAIVGNSIEATTGVNFQAGADSNVAIGNKATVTDAGTGNVVASNFVTGLRKLGEASALAGDVKLEAGSNVTLTQDAAQNKITIASAAAGGWTPVSSQLKTTFFNSFDAVSLDLSAGRFYRVLVSILNGGTANLIIEMLAQGNTTATDYRSQRFKVDTAAMNADLVQSPRIGQIVPSDGGAILDILIGGVTSGGGFFGVGAFVKAMYFGGTDVPHFEEYKWVYNVGLGTSVSITIKAAGSALLYAQGMLKVFRIA